MELNYKAMTDQELLDKSTDIHKKLVFARRFSSQSTLVESLERIAEGCRAELAERAERRVFDMLNATSKESKELTGWNNEKVQKTNGNQIATGVKRDIGQRMARTTRPVKD